MNQQPQIVYVQKERNGCLWALAAVLFLVVVTFLWLLWGTVRYAGDVNQVPRILQETVQTLEPISPAMNPQVQPQSGVIILTTSTPFPTAVPQATATTEPLPTRPAIDQLPQGEGPYTVEQMQICRDVWAQSLQAELTVHQFGYCQGVVGRGN